MHLLTTNVLTAKYIHGSYGLDVCDIIAKCLSVRHIIVRAQAIVVSGRACMYVCMNVCLSVTFYDQYTYSLRTS